MTLPLQPKELSDTDYHIQYDPEMAIVIFRGILSLRGTKDYAEVVDLLDTALKTVAAGGVVEAPPTLTLDLSGLELLNSSGINVLSRFVIRARGQKAIVLVIRGSNSTTWQTRSLKNLQRLMPKLILEWV